MQRRIAAARRPRGLVLVALLAATGAVAPPVATAATGSYPVKVRTDARMLSLALSVDGRHHVLTSAFPSSGIAYSTETGGAWTTQQFEGVTADLALLNDGSPLIALPGSSSQSHNPVRVATLANGTWSIEDPAPGHPQGPLARIRVAVGADDVIHIAYSFKSGGVVYLSRTVSGWSAPAVVDPPTAPVEVAPMWDMVLDAAGVPHFVMSGRTPTMSPGAPCVVDAGCTVDVVPDGAGWSVTPISSAMGFPDAVHSAGGGLEIALNDDTTIRYVGQVGGDWATQNVVAVNAHGSIARGLDGPVIFYADGLVGLRRADRSGSTWSNSSIAAGGQLAEPVAAFDALARPHIGYTSWYRDAQYNGEHADTYLRAPDDVDPTVGAPGLRPKRLATIGSTIPMTVSWPAADSQSGLDHFRLQQRTDGGPWSSVSSTLTTKSTTRNLSVGRSYEFRVSGHDKAGNVSAWFTSPASRVSRYTEASSLIQYTGTWTFSSSSTADGGRTKFATSSAARATFRFTGKAFAWVAPMSSTRGRAEIWIDGLFAGEVNTYKSTTSPRAIVYSVSWATTGTHTVQIRNLPTSTRKRIDIDAILVVR